VAWLLLLAAGILEIVWALAFDRADGFSRLWPSLLGAVAAVASLVLLTASLRHLPVGTAYAVWTGIGAVVVAVVGIVALGEPASAARLACLALIVSGVAGLRLLGAQ
jgi:quaternary ammonium compound-resistance protein SugE